MQSSTKCVSADTVIESKGQLIQHAAIPTFQWTQRHGEFRRGYNPTQSAPSFDSESSPKLTDYLSIAG